MTNAGKMLNAAFVLVPTAHHQGAWRSPLSRTDYLTVDFWADLGRKVEEAGFDMLFLPDILSHLSVHNGGFEDTLRYGGQSAICPDPLMLLGAICAVTKRIGLGATLSATFFPAYAIARSLATLDHISGGRAAWNVVMSTQKAEAENFGLDDIPGRQDRYGRGDDYLETCFRLWDSWEPGALIADKETGIFADPDKVHPLPETEGLVRSKGPLTIPRSPQGKPVILQAGSSDRGRDFAARWGEVVFTIQRNQADMKAFRDDVRERAEKLGRDPDGIKVLPACQAIVGETESIARERAERMNELVDQRAAVATLSAHLGIDLSGHALDEPATDLELQDNAQAGTFNVVTQATADESLTLGEAARRFATSELTPQFVGSGEQVADQLEEHFGNGCCDGFTFTSTYLPGCYEDFGRLVTPELRRRGLVEPAGGAPTTLREALGTQVAAV